MIRVQGLSYRYPGPGSTHRPWALDKLSFSVSAGDMVGLVGPAGAGKTTLFRILAGLRAGWQGEVQLLRRPLRAWGPELYERLGVWTQRFRPLPQLSALEHLQYRCELHQVRTHSPMSVLEWVGMQELAATRIKHLSASMKHRLGLVTSLLHDPELWLINKPFTGLDVESHKSIISLIRKQHARGMTIVMFSEHEALVRELGAQVIGLGFPEICGDRISQR